MTEMTASALNAELNRRIHVNSDELEWLESPNGEVLRKRLHRVGPPESGQVTSVVRYLPGAAFPAHPHPEGEEILVLEGVFSDEHGDWPAGSFLLNPEGFIHHPFSREGCLLFVKLRQFPGLDRKHVAIDTKVGEWRSSVRRGVHWKKLYAQEPYSDHMRLERWTLPGDVGQLNFPQGVEIFVIDGTFSDAHGSYHKHSWLRLPAGSALTPEGDKSCELYIKEGGFPYLRTS
ncbi:MAG: cupin domain-containing protein [Congregibacter sp.]